jgi:hypothetical protein
VAVAVRKSERDIAQGVGDAMLAEHRESKELREVTENRVGSTVADRHELPLSELCLQCLLQDGGRSYRAALRARGVVKSDTLRSFLHLRANLTAQRAETQTKQFTRP